MTKKESKNPVVFEMTLPFRKNDIQTILNACAFGDDKPLKVKDVMADPKRWERFKELMNETAANFVEEIVAGSREACANDWMEEFSPEFDEE